MNSPLSSSGARGDAICIVGDGVIAKTAALGFAQSGHSVTLLCPDLAARPGAPDAGWDVRVYALNHGARTVLSALKVWDALDHGRVTPVDAMQVGGDGDRAGAIGFDAYGAHVGALAWIVEDRNLNQALDAALRFAHNVTLVRGAAVTLAVDERRATIGLADGASIAAALVVGADGAQSWVRGQCDIGLDYRPYHQHAVVANFACALPHHGAAHQWFLGADGIVALLPLAGDRVSLVWSAPDALAERLRAGSVGELAARVSAVCRAKLGELTPLEPALVRAFPLRLMRAHALVGPRVALVGDAAHVIHPLAGHGMNLGFADVAELVATVNAREPQRDLGEARVLARYARARAEDVLLMQLATDGLARLFGADLEPLRVIRNFGLNLLDRMPILKRRLISHALGKPG